MNLKTCRNFKSFDDALQTAFHLRTPESFPKDSQTSKTSTKTHRLFSFRCFLGAMFCPLSARAASASSPAPASTRPRSASLVWGVRWAAAPAALWSGLGASVLLRRFGKTKRRAVEALHEKVRPIVSQLRKIDKIIAAYKQLASYKLPKKSTQEGLQALKDLELLASGDSDSKASQAVAASMLETGDFSQLVARALETLGSEKDLADLGVDVEEITSFLEEPVKEDRKITPLPACEGDPAPNAQNSRWPLLAALDQACQDGQRNLGISEAAFHDQEKLPNEKDLKSMLGLIIELASRVLFSLILAKKQTLLQHDFQACLPLSPFVSLLLDPVPARFPRLFLQDPVPA